jgi:hypothetical protein
VLEASVLGEHLIKRAEMMSPWNMAAACWEEAREEVNVPVPRNKLRGGKEQPIQKQQQ